VYQQVSDWERTGMTRQPELTEELKAALAARLRGRPEILFVILFGSAAEGQSFRDLDLGVCVDRAQVPPAADFDFELRLEEDLTGLARCPIDVRVINDAPLGFRYNVSRGQPLWLNDEEAYHRFRERTWDEWFDFEPIAMQYLKEQR
jgi:uncharacterized protein